jgi:hypothetical protein
MHNFKVLLKQRKGHNFLVGVKAFGSRSQFLSRKSRKMLVAETPKSQKKNRLLVIGAKKDFVKSVTLQSLFGTDGSAAGPSDRHTSTSGRARKRSRGADSMSSSVHL